MESKFTVKDYFAKNYGLGDCPEKPKLNFKALFLCLIFTLGIGTVLLIVVHVIKLGAYKKWWDEYNNRRNTWDGELVKAYTQLVKSMNLKERALNRIGIDEESVKSAEPFCIFGQKYDGWYRRGADGAYRTDNREITWLFFGADQIYIYTINFSMTGDRKNTENTLEFFYSDIVSVSTGTVSTKLAKNKSLDTEEPDEEFDSEAFTLTVPGDKMHYAFTTSESITRSIQGLKNLIRTKKNG